MKTKDELKKELAGLFNVGSDDMAHSTELAESIAAGKLRLPPCFNVKRGTPEQTKRAHELARLLTAN